MTKARRLIDSSHTILHFIPPASNTRGKRRNGAARQCLGDVAPAYLRGRITDGGALPRVGLRESGSVGPASGPMGSQKKRKVENEMPSENVCGPCGDMVVKGDSSDGMGLEGRVLAHALRRLKPDLFTEMMQVYGSD